jgi:hypothetical protein
MLEVTTSLGVTNPQVTRGTTVIIRDTYGNPIVFIIESSESTTSVYTCANKEKFAEIARHLGIDQLAVCDTLEMEEWSQKPKSSKLLL